MSTYKPESQLSRVNREAAAGPVKVDPELARLVARALEFSEMSGGAFDITYASVGYLYDYRAGKHPTDAEIAAALPAINWRHVVVDLSALDDPVPEARRAHRPRRHRQGPRGRFLHRDPGGARHLERDRHGRRRQPDPRRPARAAVDRRHPPPGRPRARDRAHPARGRGDLDLGRLRAVLRRGRRALPPHHRPEDGQEPARGAQRHHHRADLDPRRGTHEERLHHGARARASRWSRRSPTSTRWSSPRRGRCSTRKGWAPAAFAQGTSPRTSRRSRSG